MKKTIIHFIFDLTRGGAETMLVKVIKELTEYNHVVVTLFKKNHFGTELNCKKLICMNLNSIAGLPLAIFKFKKILKQHEPVLVHTHLIWPTVVARLATPHKIPLLTTIHTSIASAADYKRWEIRLFDKITYKYRKSIIIAVSNCAYKDYFSFLKLKPYKAYTLHTFVDTTRFNAVKNTSKAKADPKTFKLISVGALRHAKNYFYIIEAFNKLKNYPAELHIYGTGILKTELQNKILETDVNVILMGEVNNIQEIIINYDFYVMSSLFEGFSLSVLEAMAMQMPMLLSDIPSFREQCADTAVFFDLNNTADFISKLKQLAADKDLCNQLAAAARQRVINNFTLQHHMKGLRKIYADVLNNN